jgi:hypothetical protein
VDPRIAPAQNHLRTPSVDIGILLSARSRDRTPRRTVGCFRSKLHLPWWALARRADASARGSSGANAAARSPPPRLTVLIPSEVDSVIAQETPSLGIRPRLPLLAKVRVPGSVSSFSRIPFRTGGARRRLRRGRSGRYPARRARTRDRRGETRAERAGDRGNPTKKVPVDRRGATAEAHVEGESRNRDRNR